MAQGKLQLMLFELLLSGGEYAEALQAMGAMTDEAAQDNCLRQLLVRRLPCI